MSNNTLLLSIKPEYANKIFDGTKRVELRRVRPRVRKGDLVFVYVSSPVKALLGAFEVECVEEAFPHDLWNKVKCSAGISREQFDGYYAGSSLGFGIILKNYWSLSKPIDLIGLKSIWSGFHPPQSYRYLTLSEIDILSKEIKNKCAQFSSILKSYYKNILNRD